MNFIDVDKNSFIEIDNVLVSLNSIRLVELKHDHGSLKLYILIYFIGSPDPTHLILVDLKGAVRYEELAVLSPYHKYKFMEKLKEEIFNFFVRRFPCRGISLLALDMANDLLSTFLQDLDQTLLHGQKQE